MYFFFILMKNILNFFYESGQLKRVKRSGWWLIGIENPESVAEHSFRTAVIGYFLAKLEKVDENKVTLMCLFNDLHEARLNDLHKVGHKYINFKEAETKAHKEQTYDLDKNIFSLHKEFQEQKTKESIVARDADLLENAVQAKEYMDQGYKDAKNWIDNIKTILKTKNAKELLKSVEKTNSNEWWKKLKKISR